jgi:hypothetical protein
MKKILSYCAGVILFVGIISCKPDSKTIALYPIDSLVTAQINYLTKSKAGLTKSGSLSDKNDAITYTPKDTVAWINELEIFRQLKAMNKPVNRDSYLVDDNLYDPSSNLTVKAFTSLKDLPVKYVRVFYQTSIHQPRKIEALVEEKNVMYKSGRLLTMEFQQINNETVLTAYAIDGGQEMLLDDSVSFSVRGKIIID